ncbi:MAG: AsmA-like C-terminal region-containing protein [Phycisphaerales bacterium]
MVDVKVRDGSALARGRALTDINVHLALDDAGTALIIDRARAQLYGGTVSANGRVEVGGQSGTGAYSIDVNIVGSSLHGIAGRSDDQATAPPEQAGPTGTDGTVYASLALEGTRDSAAERRGRGSVRVVDGTLASNPLTLPLLQLSQLMLPLDASLDYAESSFFLQGNDITIEHFLLEGDALVLAGYGSADFETLDVDLRLRSRGRMGGLSELIASISGQLYGIHVTGPIGETKASIVAMPNLAGFFER